MANRESLKQFLTYNKDVEEIEKIYENLDHKLRFLHNNGYYVTNLNADSIVMEPEGYEYNGTRIFTFSTIERLTSSSKEVSNNIEDLAKIAIGAFISSDNMFWDYSKLPTDYIKKYFGDISSFLPNASYFEKVIVDGDTSMYYNDYLMQKGNSSSNTKANQKTKATEYGKLYGSQEDAAFIKLVFYPVIIISIIVVVAIICKFFV